MRIESWAVNCEITTRCVTSGIFLDGSALIERLISSHISTEIGLADQDDEGYFDISVGVGQPVLE